MRKYSRPVLYSHFKGKDAIMAAVAVEGFADLAARLRVARTQGRDPRQALADVAAAYVGFAEQWPALYEAMFVRAVDLPFGASAILGIVIAHHATWSSHQCGLTG